MKLHTLTPYESRMYPYYFGLKRSKVKVTGQWWLKMVSDSVILKLHTCASHESRMCPIDFRVGQGHWAFVIENGFQTITDSVIHLWSWNFTHLLPMSKKCALSICGSKGQGHGMLLIKYCFRTINYYVIHLWSWNFIHLLLRIQECALLNFWSMVKFTGYYNDWKLFMNSKLYIIHLWSWNFIHLLLMSQGCVLLILGSKFMGYWGLKIVRVFHVHSKAFLQLGFCIFDAPITCIQISSINRVLYWL